MSEVNKLLLIFAIILLISFSFIIGRYSNTFFTNEIKTQPKIHNIFKIDKPYEKYSIESLKATKFDEGSFKIIETLDNTKDYTSNLFEFSFKPEVNTSLIKKTTGVLNTPNGGSKYPIILMIRGYVDPKIYYSGMGTKNAANYFAKKEFITISPDFLGYSKSDKESENIFETRFQTYVTVLTLIHSINTKTFPDWNGEDLFIWGHSNGGQIALTLLETTDKYIPAVLWAPVTKPFPYSILYYTDDSDDKGKLIRKELSYFEELYNVDKYSIENYINSIKSPIQIHQGGNDDAVPLSWSDEFIDLLRVKNILVDYHTYPKADHNLQPNWDEAIKKSLDFYLSNKKS